MEELMTILQQLTVNTSNISLLGEINIDILRIKERPKIHELFDLTVSQYYHEGPLGSPEIAQL